MKHKFDTNCVHAGMGVDDTMAVVPPIYQTSTFRFRNADHGASLFAGKEPGYIYSRMLNPTVKGLEDAISALENGHKGLATASGMAAIHTVFATFVKQGGHIVCSESVYGPTTTLLKNVMSGQGIDATFVDTSDLAAVKAAIRPETKIVYVETPGNPTLVISDLAEVAKLAHDAKALFVVDNTFSSPALQRPLDFGADIVVHSMTKFLNGHADVVGGMIVVNTEDQYKECRYVLNHLGGVLPPFESYLVTRGLKTLHVRMERHCENAMKAAEFLESHPAVEWVKFPGLESHPQYAIAKKQMDGPGGMISFELKGGIEAGKAMMDKVKVCQLAVSLGGVESLIQHPASMTHAGMPKELREQAGITDGLVRLSVGIEDVDEIIADLDNALK